MNNNFIRNDLFKFAIILNRAKFHGQFWLMTSVLCFVLLFFRQDGVPYGSWEDYLVLGLCLAGGIMFLSDVKNRNGRIGNLHLFLGSLVSICFSFAAHRPLNIMGHLYILAIFADNILDTQSHRTAKILALSLLMYLAYFLKVRDIFYFSRELVIGDTAAHIITSSYLFTTFYIIAAKITSCPEESQHGNIYYNDYCKNQTVLPCQYYHELFDLVPDIVYLTDLEGKILDANKALLDITGYSKEELKNKSVMDFFAVEDFTPFWNARKELKKGNTIRNLEIKALVRNGRTRIFEINVCPVSLENRINGTINIARDVTDKKRYEAIVLRQERRAAMGSLTTDFAHNFNNHLMKISGQLQIMDMEPESVPDLLPKILRSCDEASEVVRRLTYMAPKRNLKSQNFDLPDQIELFLSLIPNGNRNKITFEREHHEKIRMTGDPLNIQQILQILMDNSLEAIGSNGKISISTKREDLSDSHVRCQYCLNDLRGDWIVLKITDNGRGVDPHYLERIFDPFYSTKDDPSGVGLGLFQLVGILEKMKGHIRFEGSRGVGTIASVYFPAEE